jgi:hypothetical protein
VIDRAEAAIRDQSANARAGELEKVLHSLRHCCSQLLGLLPPSRARIRGPIDINAVATHLQHSYTALRAVVTHTPYAAVFYADGCVCHPDAALADSASIASWRS